ncbi:hypothetical protein N7G274_006792 [Stereocaulon virgatum]|uniref:Uncharacterized protein n=1 Tax=Stereocaulon virgatum TaxID=373712 RepID=A0ABR4A345_9LECA
MHFRAHVNGLLRFTYTYIITSNNLPYSLSSRYPKYNYAPLMTRHEPRKLQILKQYCQYCYQASKGITQRVLHYARLKFAERNYDDNRSTRPRPPKNVRFIE